MKTPLAGRNAMSCIRVFLIATCIIAVTPRLSANIILLSRLSDAEAGAFCYAPPPQSQSGFLPANLFNYASCCIRPGPCSVATSTSNSSILNNSMGLRVAGDGTANLSNGGFSSAKLIVLSFTLTEVTYPYSMSGQLNGAGARATLTGETGTIFERIGNNVLSESGRLPPGNYTLSVNLESTCSLPFCDTRASFTFVLDGPVSVTRATNLSTRLLVGTGNDVGIGGFIVTGSGPQHLFLRGTGPSLANVGVPNSLADPVLELHGPAGFQTITNNNWRDTQEAEIIATGRAPSNDLESGIVVDLDPGAYTAILAGNAGTTGIGLVEVFDLPTLSPNQDSRLANISTRANVSTGDNIVIAGFILDGGNVGTTILRGLGPSLSGAGVSALADPKLELRDSQGALITYVDNWMDAPNQAAIIQAAGLAPSNNLESAIAAILLPGPYTALLSGVNNGTGVGLVEVYNNPTIPTPTPTPIGPCTENWDSVTAPALPPGWFASPLVGGWEITTLMSESLPNNAFVYDHEGISDTVLDRMGVTVTSANATLSFRNNFNTEMSGGVFWDGYVLEVSAPNISGGDFLDITDSLVGGTIVSGGYTGVIDWSAGNPLGGRLAWSGNSGGYIDTVINLGPNLLGRTVTFRFRMGTDQAVAAPGVHIDNLVFTGASCP